MNRLSLSILSSLMCLTAPLFAAAERPIYGVDSRVNLYNVTDAKVLKLADSTVAIFKTENVAQDAMHVNLNLTPYGEVEGLCSDEAFFGEPEGADCSGFLVAPDIVATAGHCINSDTCAERKFIFGFAIKQQDVLPTTVPAFDMYGCSQVLISTRGAGGDYALVQLDRQVISHKPLELNTSGKLKEGTPLFAIGNPVGLPTKVISGASVITIGEKNFRSNLDSYGGNSGSAVFNAGTNQVEGILVNGRTDFKFDSSKGCRNSAQLTDDMGAEGVTKISLILPYLKVLSGNAVQPKVKEMSEINSLR